MENVHGETYANILNMLFDGDRAAMNAYAEAIMADEALQAKISWLRDKVAAAVTLPEKILVFLLIEGIFFISSFYSIALLRARVAGVAGNGRRGCLWPCRTLPSRGPRRWRR